MTILRAANAGATAFLLLVTACGSETKTAKNSAALVFSVQPTSATSGQHLAPAVKVSVLDDAGGTVSSDASTVSLTLNSSTGATLCAAQSVKAVAGVATFTDVCVHGAGKGFTLGATSASLKTATSATFDVNAVATGGTCSASEDCGPGDQCSDLTCVPTSEP